MTSKSALPLRDREFVILQYADVVVMYTVDRTIITSKESSKEVG